MPEFIPDKTFSVTRTVIDVHAPERERQATALRAAASRPGGEVVIAEINRRNPLVADEVRDYAEAVHRHTGERPILEPLAKAFAIMNGREALELARAAA